MNPANLVGETRQHIRDLFAALDGLRSCRRRYDALGGVADGALIKVWFDANVNNQAVDITAAEFAAGFSTIQTFENGLSANNNAHAASLTKLT